MSDELTGRTVAVLATDGVERAELDEPCRAVREAGGRVEVLSLASGQIDARVQDLKPGGAIAVDREVGAAEVDDFDGLVLPGGTVNADRLRLDTGAVRFVESFVRSGKPVAVICHGPWSLIEAGVVAGRTLTSYPSIRTDLSNAGATVVDEPVVIDGNLISSRSPADLPAFCQAIVDQFAATPAR